MSEARPSTWAESDTIPTEAVCAVDSIPRTTTRPPARDSCEGIGIGVTTPCAYGSLIGRLDPEADALTAERFLDPVPELERFPNGSGAAPIVDEIVSLILGPEAEIFEEVGDLRIGRALAIELKEEEGVRARSVIGHPQLRPHTDSVGIKPTCRVFRAITESRGPGESGRAGSPSSSMVASGWRA